MSAPQQRDANDYDKEKSESRHGCIYPGRAASVHDLGWDDQFGSRHSTPACPVFVPPTRPSLHAVGIPGHLPQPYQLCALFLSDKEKKYKKPFFKKGGRK
jgi:hypothetical protein